MTSSPNAEWLSLLDISGPFLSPKTLADAFPQGLDAVDLDTFHYIWDAYEEWRDAAIRKDPKLDAFTREWINVVLRDALEYDEALVPYSKFSPEARGKFRATSDGGAGSFAPDCLLWREGDDAPVLLIKALPSDASPRKVDEKDEWRDSPAEKMTRLCRLCGVRLGLVANGEEWTLVNAPDGALSGTATWHARLWSSER